MRIILTILLLLSSTVAKCHGHADETNETNETNLLNLQGGDIIHNNNNFPTEERALSNMNTCDVKRSAYLGCYKHHSSSSQKVKGGFVEVEPMSRINWQGYTAGECETKCAEKGFVYFARWWRGQVSIM